MDRPTNLFAIIDIDTGKYVEMEFDAAPPQLAVRTWDEAAHGRRLLIEAHPGKTYRIIELTPFE